jgi:hypothetical protein
MPSLQSANPRCQAKPLVRLDHEQPGNSSKARQAERCRRHDPGPAIRQGAGESDACGEGAGAGEGAGVSIVGPAFYDGLGNRLVLADALEENTRLELAQHFRQEE